MKRLLAALALAAAPLAAQATDVLFTHQGRLLDGSDAPVDSSGLSMIFDVYAAEVPSSHETPVWEDTQNVAVTKGVFAVQLGGGEHRMSADVFPPGEERYLQVTVAGTKLLPRLRIGTVPTAALSYGLDCVGCVQAKQLADGSVTDAKILDLAAGKITGQLADTQLAAIAASKVTGQLDDAQIASISASKVTGTIPTSQLSGTIASDQIAGLAASKITGTLATTQLPSIPAAQISGVFATTQLPQIPAAQLSGVLATTQLPLIPTTLLSGSISSDQIASLDAGKLTGTISSAQLAGGIGLDKLSGGGTISGTVAASGRVSSGAGVKVAAESGTTCNGTTAGLVRYNNGVFEGCNGTAWVAFAVQWGTQTNPALSCWDLKQKAPTTPDGTYWIKPALAANAFQAFCDMTTDGGGYTYYAVSGGPATCRYTDNNGCKALGMDVVVPRSKAHWQAMFAKFGAPYFAVVPGIWAPTQGVNYTGCIMRHSSYGAGCPDWRGVDGGRWWIRDSVFTEPNGDYTAGCWLGLTAAGFTIDATTIANGQGLNDGSCNYCATNYICSTNDKP